MSTADNIAGIRERMARATARVKRDLHEITLMAVTKTVEPERIRQAYEAGLRVFGANRVQEFAEKQEAVHDLKDSEWHLIVHLQSNKARKATEAFQSLGSVDSLRLAER